MKTVCSLILAGLLLALGLVLWPLDPMPTVQAQADFIFTLRAASVAPSSANSTSDAASGLSGSRSATVFLDATTLTLPDADDEVDFYIQTSYDSGTNWVDAQNFHFAQADNGTTPKRVAAVDGVVGGPGLIRTHIGTDPAAGADWSETVPAGRLWSLKNIFAQLVTSATVANRNPHLVLDNGGATIYFRRPSGTNITASQTRDIFWLSEMPIERLIGNFLNNEMPLFPAVPGGHRIRVITTAIEVGDNWGAPVLLIEEWHDPRAVTDGTIGDNLRSYGRLLGQNLRIKVTVTGATAPTYDYTATALIR